MAGDIKSVYLNGEPFSLEDGSPGYCFRLSGMTKEQLDETARRLVPAFAEAIAAVMGGPAKGVFCGCPECTVARAGGMEPSPDTRH